MSEPETFTCDLCGRAAGFEQMRDFIGADVCAACYEDLTGENVDHMAEEPTECDHCNATLSPEKARAYNGNIYCVKCFEENTARYYQMD